MDKNTFDLLAKPVGMIAWPTFIAKIWSQRVIRIIDIYYINDNGSNSGLLSQRAFGQISWTTVQKILESMNLPPLTDSDKVTSEFQRLEQIFEQFKKTESADDEAFARKIIVVVLVALGRKSNNYVIEQVLELTKPT